MIYLPIRNSVYLNGYVLQIITDDSLKKNIFSAELKQFIYSLLFTLSLIVLLLYFFTKKITQPIRYLVKKVNQFSIGENVSSIKVRGSSETEFLGEEFNHMVVKINTQYLTLEAKVEERTNQLNTKNKELQKLLEERGLLMKETHHRVKNNLQIISSLLNLQAGKVKSKEAIDALNNSMNRVLAMALLHEKLYKEHNFITINASNYLQDIINALKGTIQGNISITVKPSDVVYNATESISIGLITNEAIINSLKHAFNTSEEGIIEVETSHTESDIILKIFNDGKKLPENYNTKNLDSLGMTIIEAFVEKLDGEFTFKNIENGVLLIVTFPKTFSSDFFE